MIQAPSPDEMYVALKRFCHGSSEYIRFRGGDQTTFDIANNLQLEGVGKTSRDKIYGVL